MIVEAQVKQIDLHITGIGLSAAFDTINCKELLAILAGIVNEYELRIARLLFSNTNLDIKLKEAETTSFESNVGSPQGNGISGVFYKAYLEEEDARLRRARGKQTRTDTRIGHGYAASSSSTSMPSEMIYEDDNDFPTEHESRKEEVLNAIYSVFPERNLKANEDKTEHTLVKETVVKSKRNGGV